MLKESRHIVGKNAERPCFYTFKHQHISRLMSNFNKYVIGIFLNAVGNAIADRI